MLCQNLYYLLRGSLAWHAWPSCSAKAGGGTILACCLLHFTQLLNPCFVPPPAPQVYFGVYLFHTHAHTPLSPTPTPLHRFLPAPDVRGAVPAHTAGGDSAVLRGGGGAAHAGTAGTWDVLRVLLVLYLARDHMQYRQYGAVLCVVLEGGREACGNVS